MKKVTAKPTKAEQWETVNECAYSSTDEIMHLQRMAAARRLAKSVAMGGRVNNVNLCGLQGVRHVELLAYYVVQVEVAKKGGN